MTKAAIKIIPKNKPKVPSTTISIKSKILEIIIEEKELFRRQF